MARRQQGTRVAILADDGGTANASEGGVVRKRLRGMAGRKQPDGLLLLDETFEDPAAAAATAKSGAGPRTPGTAAIAGIAGLKAAAAPMTVRIVRPSRPPAHPVPEPQAPQDSPHEAQPARPVADAPAPVAEASASPPPATPGRGRKSVPLARGPERLSALLLDLFDLDPDFRQAIDGHFDRHVRARDWWLASSESKAQAYLVYTGGDFHTTAHTEELHREIRTLVAAE